MDDTPARDEAISTASARHHIVTGLTKIGLATRHHAWVEASEQGLTPTQGQILALLRFGSQRGMRLSEIASALAITPATTSEAVRVLDDKQLVRKTRAPDDARALAITLTPTGHDVATRAASWSDFLLDAIDVLSPGEQAAFLRGLSKMIRALQVRGEIPVSRMCVTCRFFHPNVHPNAVRPHHCGFVDAAFGDDALRISCEDHDPATPERAEKAWATFAGPN